MLSNTEILNKTQTTNVDAANFLHPKKSSVRFKREKLPYPIGVLCFLGIKPGKANRRGYWIIRCPFHKNGQERKPSLNLLQVNGNYLCHACGAKGGDILDFFMKVTGKSFINAIETLGAVEVVS